MDPITLRLPSDLLDELSHEADKRGYSSRSEYIRHVLRDRSDTGPATGPATNVSGSNTQGNTDVTGPATNAARLDAIEERVADLEERLADRDRDDSTGERVSESVDSGGFEAETPPQASAEPDADAVELTMDDIGETPAIDDVVDEWEPEEEVNPGRARTEGRRAATWLRDQDEPRTKSEFIDALARDSPLSDRVWWERAARPALGVLADAGLVEYRAGHHDYEWIGDE